MKGIIKSVLAHFLPIFASACLVIAIYERHYILMIIAGGVCIYTWITLAILFNELHIKVVQER